MGIEFFYIYARVFALVALLILIFALWVAAELFWSVGVRIGMGATAISMCCALAFVIGGFLATIQSNIYFGEATYELVDASIDELERGRSDAVLNALQRLCGDYRVSYENRGNYHGLVKNAIAEMRSALEAEEPDESEPRDE